MLPIAYSIALYGTQSLQYLISHQLSQDDFRLMLSKWLCYYPNFSDGFSRDLTRKCLALILEVSATDLEFAGLKLQPGVYSKEGVLLQVGILSMLSSDLVYMPKEEG